MNTETLKKYEKKRNKTTAILICYATSQKITLSEE